MPELKVMMPYIGRNLSVNYYKVRGRRGVQTNHVKPEVRAWQLDLADQVRDFPLAGSFTIHLFGTFKDFRIPDLHNLHKVIGDAIAEGTGLNDRYFKFVDEGYEINSQTSPKLLITLTS